MSVVGASTRRRWSVVVVGVALLVGWQAVAPTAARMVDEVDRPAGTVSPSGLVERALKSDEIPHEAVARVRGSLGPPDLPRLGGVAGLLGSTTRARVWWSSAKSWRVDRLWAGGEVGTYRVGPGIVVWDYGNSRLTMMRDRVLARLPRLDDLLPPMASRRLLAGVGGSDRVSALGSRRIAGRTADGVRIVPGDARSMLGRVDIWIDPGTGLPLELRMVDRDGLDVLVSQYLEVTLGTPAEAVLIPPDPPGARLEWTSTPDLAAEVADRAQWDLPDVLAGLSRQSETPLGGTAVYGDGLVRFAVLPLPRGLADDMLDEAQNAGARSVDGMAGEVAMVTTSVLNAAVARGWDREHAYVLTGPVVPELLEAAAAHLLADPPPRRSS